LPQKGGRVNANHLSWWIWGEAFPLLLLTPCEVEGECVQEDIPQGPNFVGMFVILSVLAKVSHFNGSLDAHA
jgi:hypothetical protein